MIEFDSWTGMLHRGLGRVARWSGAVVVIPDDPAHAAGAERLLRDLPPDASVDDVRQTVSAFALRGELRAVAYVAYVAEPADQSGLVGFACGVTEVIGDGIVLLNGTGPLQEQPLGPRSQVTVRAANLSNAAKPVPPYDLRLGVAPGAGITLIPSGATVRPVDASSGPEARPAPAAKADMPPPPPSPDQLARPVLQPDSPHPPEPPTGVPGPSPAEPEPFVSVLLGPAAATPVPTLDPLPTISPPAPDPGSAPAPYSGHPAPSHRGTSAGIPIADDDVVVQGILCSRLHFNNPIASYCMVCGISMVHLTHNLVPGPRPTLGFIVFDNGSTYGLDRSYVVGREPGSLNEPNMAALAIHDDNETLSRRHAELRLVDWEVHLVDLGSTNGTFVWDVNFERWNQISANQPVLLSPGDTVALGRRTFVYESVTRL